MRHFFIFFFILFFIPYSHLFSQCPKEKLNFGYDDWPPYQFKDSNKKPTGLDIDIITTVLKEMNCPYILRTISWKAHISRLKKGKYHLAGGASKNEERKKFAYFSDSYRTESAIMLVQKKKLKNLISVKNLKEFSLLKNFRLGVNRGNWYGEAFEKLSKEKYFKKIIKTTTKEIQLYKMLNKGRISGILVDKYSGFSFLKKLKYREHIIPHPVKIYSDDIFVMFSKKSVKKSFVEQFNKSLKKIKDDGTHKKILNRYIN